MGIGRVFLWARVGRGALCVSTCSYIRYRSIGNAQVNRIYGLQSSAIFNAAAASLRVYSDVRSRMTPREADGDRDSFLRLVTFHATRFLSDVGGAERGRATEPSRRDATRRDATPGSAVGRFFQRRLRRHRVGPTARPTPLQPLARSLASLSAAAAAADGDDATRG